MLRRPHPPGRAWTAGPVPSAGRSARRRGSRRRGSRPGTRPCSGPGPPARSAHRDQHDADDVVEVVRDRGDARCRLYRGSGLVTLVCRVPRSRKGIGDGCAVADGQGDPVAGLGAAAGVEAHLGRERLAVASTRGDQQVDPCRASTRVGDPVGDQDVDLAADEVLRRPPEELLGPPVDDLDAAGGVDLDDRRVPRERALAGRRSSAPPSTCRRPSQSVSARARAGTSLWHRRGRRLRRSGPGGHVTAGGRHRAGRDPTRGARAASRPDGWEAVSRPTERPFPTPA